MEGSLVLLVAPGPAHGLAAAPRPSADLIPGTEQSLAVLGFTWNTAHCERCVRMDPRCTFPLSPRREHEWP
ncbi:hypothetical protein EJC51_47465 [Streptomyces aquilus]|uniref:Uncharacterized protein n=1 Tax=Streptomyces aquilus TaxID=2548456 RepID=A0A3Q9C2X1_9ACTN|nr:hypothetical protein [Streptomyces aquilus]AZP14713.1 hypothetical protein EJC51_00080 [Streptomyces aquilus]AZP22991.1 hypothetical protein EJC51_47465 [Streptomyces aquilus]